jgi:hypothetical protein
MMTQKVFKAFAVQPVEVLLAPGEKGHFGSGEKGQLSVG